MKSHIQMGIVWGCFLATFHLVWSLLVLTGLAQPLVNFIFWLHMLSVPVQVQPFELGVAALLVGVTWCVGFGFGFVFSLFWNASIRGARQRF